MNCLDNCAHRARHATGLAVLATGALVLCGIAGSAAAGAESPPPPVTDARNVMAMAMEYQLQFRAGDLDVVPKYVALLEEATTTMPDNADLWYGLGRAYLMQGARAMLPGGNAADAAVVMQKAPAALKRALQIDPDHPDALAQLGGVQALMASMLQAPALARQGMAQMNRAVELAPLSTRVRLTRAFLGLNLPDELRDHAREAEDLDFFIEDDYGRPATDYVRIMRADLDFERGEAGAAREAWQLVVDTGSPAAAREAKSRLTSVEGGGRPMQDIRALRSAAGAQCAMCHGK